MRHRGRVIANFEMLCRIWLEVVLESLLEHGLVELPVGVRDILQSAQNAAMAYHGNFSHKKRYDLAKYPTYGLPGG